jgi:predicted metal-dependent phosphoesterase TrpH
VERRRPYPRELVDLYGRAGFDVLAITDHVVRTEIGCHVRAETYRDYLDEVDKEAERAGDGSECSSSPAWS